MRPSATERSLHVRLREGAESEPFLSEASRPTCALAIVIVATVCSLVWGTVGFILGVVVAAG